MTRPKVLFALPILQEAMDKLAEEADIIMAESVDEDYMAEAAAEVDAILVRGVVKITEKVIRSAKNLKVIARHGVGCDSIDVAVATELGIPVVYSPGSNTNSVAEHALALLLAVAKQLRQSDIALRGGNYDSRLKTRTVELQGKTLGVVGLGNIGRRFILICQNGFGMKVVGYDPYVDKKALAEAGLKVEVVDSLADVLQEADFVSLHAPSLPDTYKIMGREQFARMKESAFFINAARGPLVDEDALYEALQKGEIAGAGIDVFDPEPPAKDNPLFQLPNVVVTPHTAANGDQALRNMAFMAVNNMLQVLRGEEPVNVFNREVMGK